MRSHLLAFSALLIGTAAASAEVLAFEEKPFSDLRTRATWADYLPLEEPREMVGGAPASSLTAVVRAAGVEWTVAQMHDRGWCGVNTCSTRVFRDGEIWLGGDLCMRGVGDEGHPWRLDPDAKTLEACGRTFDLAPEGTAPERLANGTFLPAPGWSTAVTAANSAAEKTREKPAPAAVADVLGEPFDHNGSSMTIAHQDGLIVYARPKKSIRDSVKPGTVLFRGDMSNPSHVTGTAYTFRKGCAPAPYAVSGRFAGGMPSGTLTLKGKAPRRAKSGCEVVGYTATGGNAKLVFEYEAPPEL